MGPSPPAADAPFRAEAPPLGPVAEPSEAVRQTSLPNGLNVVFVERHDAPVVAVRMLVDRGALDLDDPAGIRTREMQYLYARGGDETAFERLSEERAEAGLTWSAGGNEDCSWEAVRAPSHAFGAALTFLAEMEVSASLSRSEYERRAAELKDDTRLQPLAAAEHRILFGAAHPYAYLHRFPEPISFAEAKALRARIFQPQHATLIVVGDVTPAEVDSSAMRWFGAWTATASLERRVALPAPFEGPRFAVVPERHLTQRHAAVFARGPLMTSEDADAFALVAKLLGGSTSGTLFEHLREGAGATYGVAAPVHALRVATWLSISASYDADKALGGVREVLGAIDQLRRGSVNEEDLRVAREALVSGWRGEMSTVDGASSLYASWIAVGRDVTRLNE